MSLLVQKQNYCCLLMFMRPDILMISKEHQKFTKWNQISYDNTLTLYYSLCWQRRCHVTNSFLKCYFLSKIIEIVENLMKTLNYLIFPNLARTRLFDSVLHFSLIKMQNLCKFLRSADVGENTVFYLTKRVFQWVITSILI